jgi:hypothetical protein
MAQKKANQSKRRQTRPVPLTQPAIPQRRGVVTFDTDEILVLVKAPVEPVARAFVKHTSARTWVPNALGRTLTLTSHGYVLLQFSGHPYTIISLYAGFFGAAQHHPKPEHARALSETLATKAIYYANSDTAGVTAVDVYEAGRQVERLHCASDVTFTSTLRGASEYPEPGAGVYSFTDRLMREHDAFVPQLGMSYGGTGLKPGYQTKLDTTARALNLDLDYPEGVADDFPLFERVDFVEL